MNKDKKKREQEKAQQRNNAQIRKLRAQRTIKAV